jgi:hypothetical protein
MWYKLDEDKNPVPLPFSPRDEDWDKNRRVGWDRVGDYDVSTVFLQLDHGFGGGPPVLFETMVFETGGDSTFQERYCTWTEAEAGHKAVVEAVKEAQGLE